jgi:biotin carboxylase
VKTTIPFHRRVLASDQFRSGDITTDFLEHFLADEPAAA